MYATSYCINRKYDLLIVQKFTTQDLARRFCDEDGQWGQKPEHLHTNASSAGNDSNHDNGEIDSNEFDDEGNQNGEDNKRGNAADEVAIRQGWTDYSKCLHIMHDGAEGDMSLMMVSQRTCYCTELIASDSLPCRSMHIGQD